ncbi:MAG: triose-phosphate isomerase [Bacteroidota bacterium]
MRKLIAAGNWKMNLTAEAAQSLASEVVHNFQAEYQGSAEVIMGVPFPYLPLIHHLVKDNSKIHLAAQTLHEADKGAFTGETSAQMLTSVGVTHVIIGHSERRAIYGEGNALLASKVDQALANNLVPIFCIGETLEQREAGNTLAVNAEQLSEGTFHLDAEAFGKLIVAYEPVWAIGTGRTASPEQAQEVHASIRAQISEKYGAAVADNTTILYGGSVKPANAESLFGQPDIDGGLVGGASLKSRDFTEIIKALN